jgi:hypothetical protein
VTAPEHESPDPCSPRRRRAAVAVDARRLLLLTAAAVAALAATAAAAARPSPRLEPPRLSEISRGPASFAESVPTRTGLRRAEIFPTWDYHLAVADGNTVDIHVSTSYPDDQAKAQGWANFLAGLMHGSELSDLNAYFLRTDQVEAVCGDQALACYGGDQLYAPATDPSEDLSLEAVLTHEYGHHVAAHRSNAPWDALDYGPKRWASHVNVCLKAKQKKVFPGAEDLPNYLLNPGEGWAESYRVANERRSGIAEPRWEIVSRVFYPNAAALAAVQQDVLSPWTKPATSTRTGSLSKARRSRSFTLATPLDGTLSLKLKAAPGARFGLDVYVGSNRIARSRTGRAVSVTSTVCGRRSLRVKVRRQSGAGRFTLAVAEP